MPAPFQSLGFLIQAARTKRGLTQHDAARGAGVSRKQWSRLEQGHNVSVLFLRKVAAYLDLTELPLGDGLRGTTGAGAFDVAVLMRMSDELAAVVEQLRAFALDAALPPSERTHDAAAIASFVEKSGRLAPAHAPDLRQALQRLASDVVSPPEKPLASPRERAPRRRKREAR